MVGKSKQKARTKKAELPPRAMSRNVADLDATPTLDLAPPPPRASSAAPVLAGDEPPSPEPVREVAPRSNRVTYYMVQRFIRDDKGRVIRDMARQASDRAAADRLAKRLAESCAGTVAFSRTGDPETGDVDDAILVARYGEVPEDLLELS